MKIILLTFFYFFSNSAIAELLDKISGVFNDNIYTVSQLRRISETLEQRRQVTPQLYDSVSKDLKSIQNLLFDIEIIREGLKEIGYQITDERVDDTINDRQKMLGLNRDQLVRSLKEFKISFNEYFELIRASLEYKVFFEVIILPLVNITEQEIKNEFLKNNKDKKSVAITYNLTNYSVPLNQQTRNLDIKRLVESYRESAIIPNQLKGLQQVDIDDVSEESLIPKFKQALKGVPEGGFSKPVIVENKIHLFYVINLTFKNSEFFDSQKNNVRAGLLEKAAKEMKEVWIRRESDKYFIKHYL